MTSLEMECALKYGKALEKIKAAVEQNDCSIAGAFALRADVKAILSEAGL